MDAGTSAPRRDTRGKILLACVASVAMLSGLAGCGGGAESVAAAAPTDDRIAYSGPARTVKIGVLRQPHLSHPLFYAPFLPPSLRTEIVPFANSTEIKNAVVSGDLQFGVTGITSAVQGAAAGDPLVIVAAAADGGSAVVARQNSGIATVADLRGKRIGYVPGSAQDVLLRLTLRQAGIDAERDVNLINVQFADMAPALARGDIDAFSGAETGPSDALVAGTAALVSRPYDTPIGKINIALVTSRATLNNSRDLVAAMVAVHGRATEYMRANPDQWVARVSQEYGYRPEVLGRAVQNIDLRWQIDSAYVEAIRMLGAQQVALGTIDREPDYASLLDLAFAAAPSVGVPELPAAAPQEPAGPDPAPEASEAGAPTRTPAAAAAGDAR